MIWWMLGGLVNIVIGAFVFELLDTKDGVFYNWFKEDPTQGFIQSVLLLTWPLMATVMVIYRYDDKFFMRKQDKR